MSTEEINFDLQLCYGSIEETSDQNILLSPASIGTCLALIYLGSEGVTAEQLRDVLDLDGHDKIANAIRLNSFLHKTKNNAARIMTANGIYVDEKYEISENFKEIAMKFFETAAVNVDFSKARDTAKQINTWVLSQTNGMIRKCVTPNMLQPETEAVLVNGLYFKARWLKHFEPKATRKADFLISADEKVRVDMMFQENIFMHGEIMGLDACAIEMPYDGIDAVMLVLLPNKLDGLPDVEAKLRQVNLMKVYAHLRPTKVSMSFPKFRLEIDFSLQSLLERMGLDTMFSEEADFGSLLGVPDDHISISEIRHKALLEFNEGGTDSSAMDGPPELLEASHPSTDFLVDHPFFFAILDKENIYLAGHVVAL